MTNHLAQEASPYLLQHAQNPVDWYPWGEEALAKASRENKPILLSIGYAACHWCHIMAHESFEDEQTAKLMNELFVNVKVDREERPDLDKIYQTAHYLLTQSQGGWPLTVFLTPNDLIPFFSGTYFPLIPRHQLPAFKDVLFTLADIYKKHPEQIEQQNQQLLTILSHENPVVQPVILNDEPIKSAARFLQMKFDTTNGGFGTAPKFPHPTLIELLMREKSTMAPTSLRHMAQGGIYDQVEGGFFRYTVDEKWEIPHFEKMLYDNAQLLFLYAEAAKELNEPYFAEIAHETAEWVITKMQAPEGGFYSSLDADSEGHEGKFYVWNKFEITELLTEQEADFANLYFGLTGPPNFEKDWHLHVAQPLDSVSETLQITTEQAKELLQSIKQKLFTMRQMRVAPACDHKILTAWNALMIKALLVAGHNLQEPRYTEAALTALHFIQQKMWNDKLAMPLLASYKDGKAYLSAYLDDYAFLLDAVITLIQLSDRPAASYVAFAKQLADNLLDHFYDTKVGGFFFTADGHEKVLYRPKTMMDEAIPAGNGIAARALLALGRLVDEPRYVAAAEKTLQVAWPAFSQFPAEHCSLLLALNDFIGSSQGAGLSRG